MYQINQIIILKLIILVFVQVQVPSRNGMKDESPSTSTGIGGFPGDTEENVEDITVCLSNLKIR